MNIRGMKWAKFAMPNYLDRLWFFASLSALIGFCWWMKAKSHCTILAVALSLGPCRLLLFVCPCSTDVAVAAGGSFAFVGVVHGVDASVHTVDIDGDGTSKSSRCCFRFCQRKRLSANFSRIHGIIDNVQHSFVRMNEFNHAHNDHIKWSSSWRRWLSL